MMDKRNLTGLGIMAVAAVAVVAISNPAYDALRNMQLKAAAGGAETSVVTGEAQGFGGAVTAQVTVADGRILALELTGEGETPEIGQAALPTLKDAILEHEGLEGVDAVSGATVTSTAVFNAIRTAMGEEVAEAPKAEAKELEGAATGEAQGFGGAVTASVVAEDGVITDLVLTGEGETPAIGGAALETLTKAILEAGSLEGVDAVSGATITSNAVFEAVGAALQ